MCLAEGTSYLNETVIENRFKYTNELQKMGASVRVVGHTAIFDGGAPLSGAKVRAVDLRAGAAMVIAALAVRGITEISEIDHIDRGYEDLVGKLRAVGADIRLVVYNDTQMLDEA
jgi:UDP-N-acetylglucosamine 1-carboxyvinyltransferase